MALYRQPHMECWHQIKQGAGHAKCHVKVRLDTSDTLCIEARDVDKQPDVTKVCSNCFKMPKSQVHAEKVAQARRLRQLTTVPRPNCPHCEGGKLVFNQRNRIFTCGNCQRRFVRNANDDIVVTGGRHKPALLP